MKHRTWLPRSPRLTVLIAFAALAAIAGAVALAADPQPAIQTFTPRSEKQITNIDVLRQQIKNYYGDPLAVTGSGATGTWNTHPLNLDSNYAHEAESVADQGGHWLKARSKVRHRAIVLDVDDTTLATWNYEIFSNWDFSLGTNGDFVTQELFPPVPGMVEMVSKAAQEGYAIFFITGRPAIQEAATLGNLTQDGIGVEAGYPQPTTLKNSEDGLFTKPAVADYPPYLQAACADEISQGKSCTTIHYKSATRAHIESVGYEIVADFGDQFSDLVGGHSGRTFKLPNPNYFLP